MGASTSQCIFIFASPHLSDPQFLPSIIGQVNHHHWMNGIGASPDRPTTAPHQVPSTPLPFLLRTVSAVPFCSINQKRQPMSRPSLPSKVKAEFSSKEIFGNFSFRWLGINRCRRWCCRSREIRLHFFPTSCRSVQTRRSRSNQRPKSYKTKRTNHTYLL